MRAPHASNGMTRIEAVRRHLARMITVTRCPVARYIPRISRAPVSLVFFRPPLSALFGRVHAARVSKIETNRDDREISLARPFSPETTRGSRRQACTYALPPPFFFFFQPDYTVRKFSEFCTVRSVRRHASRCAYSFTG